MTSKIPLFWLLLCTFLALSAAFCAWQLQETRGILEATNKRNADLEHALTQEIAITKALATPPSPAPVAVPPPQNLPPVAPVTQRQTIEDIYNPEKVSGDNQSAMDDIKKRYEDILVIHMFLKKCARVGAGDYAIITSALAQEMASVNAPGRMQYDILTAAQGSYKEIYAQSPCRGQQVDMLDTQYKDYVKKLAANLSTP
jgi:hypothetical protein